MKRGLFFLLTIFIAYHGMPCFGASVDLGQGVMAGEVTETSVILQSRLTEGRELVDGDLPGSPGVGRFLISRRPDFKNAFMTDWMTAEPESDYLIKVLVQDLQANTRYYYRVEFGKDKEATRKGRVCTFETLGGAEIVEPVRLVVVTGMNYYFFHYGRYNEPEVSGTGLPYQGADKQLGFPSLESILRFEPDFFIGTGDNVYYDQPSTYAMASMGLEGPLGGWAGSAKTRHEIRRKYHEQFSQSRFHDLFSRVPTYWEKDDHDYRFDDSDPYMAAPRYREGDGRPSHELGVAMFKEQLPVTAPDDPDAKTYRTYRINQLLQIWLPEGRDYRSPNNMPDGPEKTLWGEEQKAWLKRTLLESDATFKVIIHPTPMIGPQSLDTGRYPKMDNHCTPLGFKHEGEDFFKWAKDHGFLQKHLYIVVGDSHWPYHAIHFSGFEEFACGAVIEENAVVGPRPGEEGTTDPEGLIKHPYHSDQAYASFLMMTVQPEKDEQPASITFSVRDGEGKERYACKKKAAITAEHTLPGESKE
jgi:alkaline phosphatase/alkaline phosphatase D